MRVGIVGAGAIGRGYVPWLFEQGRVSFHFIERNVQLIEALSSDLMYTSHMTVEGKYQSQIVRIESLSSDVAHLPLDLDVAYVAVGTRAFPEVIEKFPASTFPIVCLENDPGVVDVARQIRPDLKIFFAVPDVIASPTSPALLRDTDRLSLVTESGQCFIENSEHLQGFDSGMTQVSQRELDEQWKAKLYIHNTPHCIAAYLGHAARKTYLHEAMSIQPIREIVQGAVDEMVQTIHAKFGIQIEFLQNYGLKEISRFQNELLCDPVERVAREPFRKLQPRERLIGAAQIALSVGVFPENIITGIVAASTYDHPGDTDSHIRILSAGMPVPTFAEIVLGISRDSALFDGLVDSWNEKTLLIGRLSA